MALIITPGAPDADAYGSLADFKVFCESVGNDISIYSDDDLEQAIRRGTMYIDATYGDRFIGRVDDVEQALEWPRKDAIFRGHELPEDEVPNRVTFASFAAAFMEAESPGSTSASFSGTGKVLREKVDVLEVQYAENADATLEDATPIFSNVEGFLLGLIRKSNSGSPSFGRIARA